MKIGREARGRPRARAYHLYGLCLRSEWPLPYPQRPGMCLAEIGLFQGSPAPFFDAVNEARTVRNETTWARGVPLADGRTYLRWSERFEFLISADGRAITARPLHPGSREVFHTYLLGQVLSYALIKQGLDPLHATVVIVDGCAVAFLGESGYGKSSLAAAFVQAGYRVLTDDLLVLSEEDSGFVAHPGPPRLKLFPDVARRLLPPPLRGTAIAHMTPKLLIPLGARQAFGSAARLRTVYVLAPPARPGSGPKNISIRRLSKRRACLELLRNTFNTVVTDSTRLTRQLLFATSVAHKVPVKRLVFPRRLASLPLVRDAILADLVKERGSIPL